MLLGFASGVMIAAAVWSLLIPSIDMAAEQGTLSWISPAVGFLLGIGFLLLLDTLIPEAQSGEHSNVGTIGVALGFVLMMVLDVALG